MHVHGEGYDLLEGEVTFHVGGDDHHGRPGSFVFFPRAVPHTFTVQSESARMLLLNAPGSFERMFELTPTTPDEAARTGPLRRRDRRAAPTRRRLSRRLTRRLASTRRSRGSPAALTRKRAL